METFDSADSSRVLGAKTCKSITWPRLKVDLYVARDLLAERPIQLNDGDYVGYGNCTVGARCCR